jgi:hypothetical protein
VDVDRLRAVLEQLLGPGMKLTIDELPLERCSAKKVVQYRSDCGT